jgi:hypothetical protein
MLIQGHSNLGVRMGGRKRRVQSGGRNRCRRFGATSASVGLSRTGGSCTHPGRRVVTSFPNRRIPAWAAMLDPQSADPAALPTRGSPPRSRHSPRGGSLWLLGSRGRSLTIGGSEPAMLIRPQAILDQRMAPGEEGRCPAVGSVVSGSPLHPARSAEEKGCKCHRPISILSHNG